jgi:hypothetical protein
MVAHRIRDHVCALANTLEVIRLEDENRPSIAKSLKLAKRQLDALARLADVLFDPAGHPGCGEERPVV